MSTYEPVPNHRLTLRQRARLTQKALAIQTGIDQSIISRMERGMATLSLEPMYLLAQALNCLPSDLVNDEAYLDALNTAPSQARQPDKAA